MIYIEVCMYVQVPSGLWDKKKSWNMQTVIYRVIFTVQKNNYQTHKLCFGWTAPS